MNPNQVIAERVHNLSNTVQSLQQELEALKGFIEVSSGIRVPSSKASAVSRSSRIAPAPQAFDDSASRAASSAVSHAQSSGPVPLVPAGDQHSVLSRVTVSRHGIESGHEVDADRTWADDLSFVSTMSKVNKARV